MLIIQYDSLHNRDLCSHPILFAAVLDEPEQSLSIPYNADKIPNERWKRFSPIGHFSLIDDKRDMFSATTVRMDQIIDIHRTCYHQQ
jgi:hypothetical protein